MCVCDVCAHGPGSAPARAAGLRESAGSLQWAFSGPLQGSLTLECWENHATFLDSFPYLRLRLKEKKHRTNAMITLNVA